MRICEEGHDEIIYDSKECPLCNAKSQIHDLEIEINHCQNDIADLEEQIKVKGL